MFWTVGAFGLLWVPLWFALVRKGDLDDRADARDRLAEADATRTVRLNRVRSPVHRARGDRDVLALSWQFIRAWLPKYLKEFHHYDPRRRAGGGLYYIAADVGCILAGYLVKVLAGRRREVHSRA